MSVEAASAENELAETDLDAKSLHQRNVQAAVSPSLRVQETRSAGIVASLVS